MREPGLDTGGCNASPSVLLKLKRLLSVVSRGIEAFPLLAEVVGFSRVTTPLFAQKARSKVLVSRLSRHQYSPLRLAPDRVSRHLKTELPGSTANRETAKSRKCKIAKLPALTEQKGFRGCFNVRSFKQPGDLEKFEEVAS